MRFARKMEKFFNIDTNVAFALMYNNMMNRF